MKTRFDTWRKWGHTRRYASCSSTLRSSVVYSPAQAAAAWVLAGLVVAACNTSPSRQTAETPSLGVSYSELSSDTHPSQGVPNQQSDADRVVLAAQRRQCLRAPLSPSAAELPELAGQRHEVWGAHGEQHVFLPPRRLGLPPAAYATKLSALTARFPEVRVTGLRSCKPKQRPNAEGEAYCLSIEVPLCEPWLERAERLLPTLSKEGLGLFVELQGRPGPRCTGDTCEPVPYHDPANTRDDLTWSGWFTLPYRSDATRSKVLTVLGRGACAHDGDCVVTGCGNHCEAWYEAPHAATCPAYPELDDAYCGCVATTCNWFVQPVLHELRAYVQVEGWVVPTHEDNRELTSGESVFRTLLEGAWFRRQLERIAQKHNARLPSRLGFELALGSRFTVIKATITADGVQAPSFLQDVFMHLPVPVPRFDRKQDAPRRLIARGHVDVVSGAEASSTPGALTLEPRN